AHDQRDFEFATKYNIPIKQVIAPLYKGIEGPDAVRIDKETVDRRGIFAIVKHWSEDKYYCLNWEKFNWRSFVLGGIDDGESAEAAAKRETIEETGYQDIKKVTRIGFESHNNFYAAHKDVNRYGRSVVFLVELGSGKYKEPQPEHIKNHNGQWLDRNEVKNFINLPNNLYYWDILTSGERAFVDYGVLINSGEFNDLSSKDAMTKITEKLKSSKAGPEGSRFGGDFTVNYKLRDWVFSRQHYWGEPIPIIHCLKCGQVPVPEKDLPVELPYVEKYQPTGTGESPLAVISDWVNVKCPKCKGDAKRETDTMPNWAGSNWYYMRYCDPENDKSLADSKKLKYWMPVDWYNGGMEHTTLHLLYSRFIYKFLYDIKAAPQPEPYQRRTSHGIVLSEDGRKMSKSFGNVINPDEIVQQFGADTLRMYEMFMGPFDQTIIWSTQGVKGVYRFLEKTWKLVSECSGNKNSSREVESALHKLNKKIDEDMEVTKFNTIVAAFMEFVNLAQEKKEEVGKETIERLLILLSPFAPHVSEELWQKIGNKKSILEEKWPKPDPKFLKEEKVTLIVQVNGKVRNKIEVKSGFSEEEARELAISGKIVKNWISDKKIKKVIFVKDKLINIVTS
ncbi:MAG: class I tRNA ligase family protein, partial [bacterium]|nr:class I tRNA ligase family protein [bacterium]